MSKTIVKFLPLHGNFDGWVQNRKVIEETVFKVAA